MAILAIPVQHRPITATWLRW